MDILSTRIEYRHDSETHIATVRHPPVSMTRVELIRKLLGAGCSLIPNVERVPSYFNSLDRNIQRAIVEQHLELLPLYGLRMRGNAQIDSTLVEQIGTLSELELLELDADRPVAPEALASLRPLTHLEVLILRGASFRDDHCEAIPKLSSLRSIDVQRTGVSQNGAKRLRDKFPDAVIYVS